jgi:hypothetical protein
MIPLIVVTVLIIVVVVTEEITLETLDKTSAASSAPDLGRLAKIFSKTFSAASSAS